MIELTALARSLGVTFVLAGIMMGIYRLCHTSLNYRRRFNITLMMLAMASQLLLTLIQNNPMFSLGALGALSICRIRTNTKDPRDLGFVFWALTIGISSALGAYTVGLMGTAALSAVMLTLGRVRQKRDGLTLVVRGDRDQVGPVQSVFSGLAGSTVQAKNLFPDSFELVYELHIPPEEEERLVVLLNGMEGVSGVNVLAPQTQVA